MLKNLTLVRLFFLFALTLLGKITSAQNCADINFNNFSILSSSGNQDNGTYAIQDDGATLYIENNAWKAIEVNYNILSNTILEFDFKSTIEGETHGIGFNNGALNSLPSYAMNIYGTQTNTTDNIVSSDYTSSGNWQTYRVEVGTFTAGNFAYIVFIADNDAASIGNSFFRNLKLYEPTTFPSVGAALVINELQADNDATIVDNFLEYDDWLEIYNTTNSPINLAGYYLSDNILQLNKFQIPNTDASVTTAPANGNILFWTDDDEIQGVNHTNFKLNTSGETVFLVDPDGVTIIDSLTYKPISDDQTYKRIPDASTNLVKSSMASPLNSNNNELGFLEPPLFNSASGTYTGSQTISLSNANGATIYYTTDGSEPNSNSTVYSSPISISQNTTIKAMATQCGFENSEVLTKVYMIDVNHDLPIFTLNIDDKYLYSDTEGMLVVGTNGASGCGGVANYHQEWEYPGNVILIDEVGNEAFNVDGGVSVFGNCTRRYAQKSLALKTKSIFKSENIPYKVFPSLDQEEFRRLRFRNGGNHWTSSMMSDLIFQSLVENKIDIEVQSAYPSVSYFNGVYNGIYNMREAYSKHYFRYKFDKFKDSDFDIIRMEKLHQSVYVVDGDSTEINNLYNLFDPTVVFTNPIIDSIYNDIDINNFINYYTTSMWVFAFDWPGTYSPSNKIYWKPKEEDTKWRIAILDSDGGWVDKNHDTYSYLNIVQPNGRNNEESTRLFRRLNNDVPQFNEEFVQRAFTYCNVLFHKDTVDKKINNYKALIENEMYDHINLWGSQGGVPTYTDWLNAVDGLKSYADGRSDSLKLHIANYHNQSIINISFNFNQNTNGTVVVNSNFFKIPNNYNGEYLSDVPMWIHAVAKPGYRFVEWQEITDPTLKNEPSIYTAFSANQTLTPIFEQALDLVINEIHYNPLGTLEDEEFIELYNPDTKAKALFGYQFNNGVEFTFPENAIINPGEYIVIAKNATQYAGNGYKVFQWECGSLNNDGEKVFFSNATEAVLDSVVYNDNIDWDQNADGLGYSLALIDHTQDNAQPSAWASQVVDQTTPGTENNFCIPITNNTTLADVSCYQANDGFIATQVSGGTPPFTYSWTNGSTSNLVSNLSSGQYTVTITDFYNCPYTETFNISEPTQLNVSTSSTDQTYYNVNDGTANINVSGGVAPYTYDWSNGANTASISNLTPSNYTVDVRDANGCQLIDTVIIQAVACTNLNVAVSTQHESCVGENDGLLQIANIQNGTTPYSILWSTGITGTVTNNLTGGVYQLEITDANGCPFNEDYTINAATNITVIENITNTTTSNSNDGSIDLTVVGGTPPYTFYWSNGSTTEDVNSLTEANYWASITDANNCQLFLSNLLVGNSCPVSIVQLNNPALASDIYQVANFIESNGMVNLTEQVSFKAGNYIELNSDFEVIQGAEFEAMIDGCQ